MYVIFKNELEIILTDKLENQAKKNFFFWDALSDAIFWEVLNKENISKIYFYHVSLDLLWSAFKNRFKKITAAGGMVRNSNGKILFIFRNGKWDLPKGKVEKGEDIRDAAIREVQEECGIENVICDQIALQNTYHIYKEKEEVILKESVWFAMQSNDQNLTPQLEEGITKVVWLKPNEMSSALKNTYPNIKLLINSVL